MRLQSTLSLLGLSSRASRPLSLFSFGDSYTSTGFNVSSTQPSVDNPMGNPPLGLGTSADSINWVGYLTTTYNDTLVLSYNHAVYGATVDNNLVQNVPRDLVHQVTRDFVPNYCLRQSLSESDSRSQPKLDSESESESESQSKPRWTSDNALFIIWIGINDINFSYLGHDYPGTIETVLQRYFSLIDTLHDCGARDFLVINIPPIHRTPKILQLERWKQRIYGIAIDYYNELLLDAVDDWRDANGESTMRIYDAWTFTSRVLDSPKDYGFLDGTCLGEGCIWFDHLHPRSAFHTLLARDIARFLRDS
ncbi:GDSL lipase/esterase [Aspergillus crustosus]